MNYKVFLALLFLSACGPKEVDSLPQHFFVNSKRVLASTEDQGIIVKLDTGCTAFRVGGPQDRVYMVTANHCVRNDLHGWCRQGGSFKLASGETEFCKNAVLTRAGDDIVLFEANFNEKTDSLVSLSLAAGVPAVGTKLKMLGFPTDAAAKGRAVAVQNCWTLSGIQPSPYSAGPFNDTVRHNCSTYGGNSGGPMMIEGTRIVVGEPFMYKDTELRPSGIGRSSYMSSMSEFVLSNRTAMLELGIDILE